MDRKIVSDIINEFYQRVQKDAMISHFFWKVDLAQLIENQIEFTLSLLGMENMYKGRSLKDAHKELSITEAQFLRRMKILEETLKDSGFLNENEIQTWLKKESLLKSVILRGRDFTPCNE